MFDPIEVIKDSPFFDSKIMVDHFLFYDFSAIPEEQNDTFDDFYFDNELEQKSIKEIGTFIKKCYEESKFKFIQPFYYSILDEEDVFNLNTGQWEDQMEIEFDN
ncbi:hypothetical protein D6T70_05245 [Kurthia gibsonii]|uniref:hypothetical protein n=1 Tax=Kurthia gibsonii TaxID=33946 RepID=UPI000EB4C7F1|nr:hypothetical protein [Kurthia gibsonii]RXH52652.1 hypothetical protein D6T70_05245 [Kurthia gibsonii]